MAKKIVKFTVTDGMKPGRSEEPGRPFTLKLPVPIMLVTGSSKRVKLGVTCNMTCVVVGKEKSEVFGPGQELSVELLAARDIFNMGAGEVVAKASPVDCTNLELAE